MQQAIPYRNWLSTAGNDVSVVSVNQSHENTNIEKVVAENAVVVFARKGCCMCHVVKLLLHGHGVNPSIFDVDETNEKEVANELSAIVSGDAPQFPAVFVGGELFGGLERIMGAHITGELVPRLREAGALWL